MKVEYRDATDADYDVCEKLHHDGMKPYCEPIWGWNLDFQQDRYKKHWKPGNIRILMLDGKVVGYLEIVILENDLKISNIFVDKSFRGNGIGTRVLEDLLENCQGQYRRVTLNVLHNNPASRLYKRLGFKFVKVKDQVHEYEYLCD